MSEDVMVIPLRVPREVGRAWKVEAVKQDKSVQRWILDQLDDLKVVHKAVSGSARMNSEVTGKSERDRQMEESPRESVNPSKSTLERYGEK